LFDNQCFVSFSKYFFFQVGYFFLKKRLTYIINKLKTLKMKKVLSLIAVAAMATMVSCGPSAEEKAKMEENAKRIADSIAAAATAAIEEAAAEAAPAEAAPAEGATEAAPAEAPAH
jgi:uncharacterized membrane protein